MAITVLADPQVFTPAYNPMYFQLDSTSKTQLGFRYLVEVVNVGTSEVIGTYTLKPVPTTLYGEVDVSNIIQQVLYTDFQQLDYFVADGHQVTYKLNIDEEYFVNTAFTDYGFAGAVTWANFSDPSVNPNGFSRTMLSHGTAPLWVAGDVILVTQTPSTNYRPELEGVHTVLDVFLSAGVYYTVLDLGWIGSGGVSAGISSYADGKKTTVAGITTSEYQAFKGAFKFLDFKNYGYTDYKLDGVTKQLLTNLTSDIRISRNKPTWLGGWMDSATSKAIEFNIGGTLYRYLVAGTANELTLFDALPTTANITETFSGSWTPFVGTIDLTGIDTYTIQVTTNTGADKSEVFTVKLYDECDNYTTYDVCFLDRLGSWITVPFYKGSYMNQDVQRETIRTKYGEFDGGDWTYNLSDKGQRTYHVEENITYSVNTGILSEAECQFYRELLSSPQAYVSIDSGEFQAITIVTASMPLHLKRTQRDRKVSLQFVMSVQDEING